MNHGIVQSPCISLRKEASEQSEMASQLLFGEIFEVLETLPRWLRVKNQYDGYEGWISRNGTWLMGTEDLEKYGTYSSCVQPDAFVGLQRVSGEEPMRVPAGSVLYFDKDVPLKVHCGETYRMEKRCGGGSLGSIRNAGNSGHASNTGPTGTAPDTGASDRTVIPANAGDMPAELAGRILKTGRQFLNIPYLWGGKSTYGTDCSGLVQTIMKILGIRIGRDTSIQVREGAALNMLPEARTGDLVFFDNEEGEIVHVGILMEEGTVLHASGRVRLDPIDHQGIYSRELKRYTHKLRVIKRVI
jgi:hypothetical protein